MSKTIKQIADELHLDKQKVYRFIKKNHINESHQKNGMMYYDEAVQILIESEFVKKTTSNEAHQTTSSEVVNEALISMLKNELDIKNKQISELTETIKNLSQSINAGQHNALAETLKDNQSMIEDGKNREKKRWQFWKT